MGQRFTCDGPDYTCIREEDKRLIDCPLCGPSGQSIDHIGKEPRAVEAVDAKWKRTWRDWAVSFAKHPVFPNEKPA